MISLLAQQLHDALAAGRNEFGYVGRPVETLVPIGIGQLERVGASRYSSRFDEVVAELLIMALVREDILLQAA